MTVNLNFKSVNPNFRLWQSTSHSHLEEKTAINMSFRTANMSFRTANMSFRTANMSFRLSL